MLESITIKGFESHNFTQVVFADGLTYISGDSHCGKSGIMRALRWVCLNESEGFSFLPHDAKRGHAAEVILFVDGHEIIRRRSRSENTYEMDGEVYKAFGDSVPTPIAKVLDLSALVSQEQLGGHFGLSYTGGDNARLINSVISLDSIDKAIAYVRAVKTKTDTDVRDAEKSVEDFTKRVESLTPWAVLNEMCKDATEPDATRIDSIRASIDKAVSLPSPVGLSPFDPPQHPPEPDGALKRLTDALKSIHHPVDIKVVEFPAVPTIDKSIQASIAAFGALRKHVELDGIFWPFEPDATAHRDMWSALRKLSSLKALDIAPFPQIERPSNVQAAGLYESIGKAKALSLAWEQSETALRSAWGKIDEYIKQHPVCPNCGAEQKHWAFKEEVTHA